MADAGVDAFGTALAQERGGGSEGAGGFRHVVHEEHVAALHFTDQVERLHLRGTAACLGHDGELAAERFGK